MGFVSRVLNVEKRQRKALPQLTVDSNLERDTRKLRSFIGASNDRLINDLSVTLSVESPNAEVRSALARLRMYSRQLSNNNEYAKRAVQMFRQKVIGSTGFGLQMKIYSQGKEVKPDKDANDTIEEAWRVFSKKKNFSADGKKSRASFERQVLQRVVIDGEVIIEKCYGRRFPFGLAFRLIDSDLLDETLNLGKGAFLAASVGGSKKSDTEIRMGVEIDEYGKPVAYWFKSYHPGDDVLGIQAISRGWRRVEADKIIHAFLAEQQRAGTTRGIPWMFSGIRRMAMLRGYEEAALVNARYGASKMLWYKQNQGEVDEAAGGQFNVEDLDAYEDDRDNLLTDMEAGAIGILPKGWDISTWDPNYPNDQMPSFVELMLRAFCAGVGINYNSLAYDLKNVNLSTMRQAANDDRDTYEEIQQWFVEQVSEEIFETWLEHGLNFGMIGTLPASAFDRLNHPRFCPRPFRSPDPQKDVAADAQAVALATKSRKQICLEHGLDYEDVIEDLAHEYKLAKEKGVPLNTDKATETKNPAVDVADKPMEMEIEKETGEDDEEKS